MKKLFFVAICFICVSIAFGATKEERATVSEAFRVIDRFTGGDMKFKLQLTLPKDEQGRDSYSYSVKKGVLTIKGSSGVALCRGFYDYIKSQGAGINSWSGNRFEQMPITDMAEKVVKSPYRDHYYLNVVTYGYTTPYWDAARWDKEIDWMALHGMDMPLVLIAQEAVYRMVFKDMGLTDAEIDEWETGPAHLPWMRMGNIAGNSFDGPLSAQWNADQMELLRHVLKRMRTLGMKPIFPAFGGFVPAAFEKHYPGSLTKTGWDWVPDAYRNYRLSPDSKYFAEVGSRFIKKWEELFGKGEYYLSDSFNEMEIPNDNALLTKFGDKIYESIHAANPDATWVMQGWTLGFQRGDWGNGHLEALLKNVPNDKMMILDMSTDYNRHHWKSSYDWDFYPKFYGKEWVWSVIPNMGGKTAMTGVLEYYANGRMDALNSPNRGNLTGYGFAPEGVENNEMIYELVADGGWTSEKIDLKTWLKQYALCRYGATSEGLKKYYDGLLASVYGSFTDHPQFGWQKQPYSKKGSVNENEEYYKGVEALFTDAESLISSKLFFNDLVEAAALYSAGKAEKLCITIKEKIDEGKADEARTLIAKLERLMLMTDYALSFHPNFSLEKWEKQASKMGKTQKEKDLYARNARRLLSVWYGDHEKNEPVNDYACRVWSGLIRDYYLPRLKMHFNNLLEKRDDNIFEFEAKWVNSAPQFSPVREIAKDKFAYLRDLVKFAGSI